MGRRNVATAAPSPAQRTIERGSLGPVLRSSTVSRLYNFATVFGLMPRSRLCCASAQFRLRTGGGQAFDLRSLYCCSDRCVVAAPPWRTCPKVLPSNSSKGSHHHLDSRMGIRQKSLVFDILAQYTGQRRCGRVVEGTPLLRVQTGNRLEGSNPFVSAKHH